MIDRENKIAVKSIFTLLLFFAGVVAVLCYIYFIYITGRDG